ncbi:uncharacterized protein LOC100571943 [Acyrthosiphon pisum]|uniref:DUF4776 domain-containing protein n=1 Tax=Acyrthosiphon pisum TaxID=7029 RepID=A0A8R2A7Y1_ACYPI|nr:uncharacterized protein LOC100571943 [Acyrthosiphon pisum]|eukprot:XP_003247758.1 PREDICTED: uncharacterized protein LOC100571943 [Acyrthosiphon pisum]
MSKKVINVNQKGNRDAVVSLNEIHLPKVGPASTTTVQLATPRRPKKRCNTKKKFDNCSRILPSEKSFDKFMTNEKIMEIALSMYPGNAFGHIDCIIQPIKTPKTMGWQWSVKETGGVNINRNWRPGAIPLDVAEIIEKVRSGTIGPLPGRNLMKLK